MSPAPAPMLVLLVSMTMRAACVQTTHASRRSSIRRPMVRRAVVGAVRAVLLVLLVFLLVFSSVTDISNSSRRNARSKRRLLVAQYVRADRTCDQSTDRTKRSTAHLVP